MSKEQDIIQDIKETYSEIKQIASDARGWMSALEHQLNQEYQTAVDDSNQEYEARVAEIEETSSLEQMQRIQEFSDADEEIRNKFDKDTKSQQTILDELRAQLNYICYPWNSDYWNTHQPIALGQSEDKVPRHIYLGDIPSEKQKTTINNQAHFTSRPLENVPAIVPFIGSKHILVISDSVSKTLALQIITSIVARIAITFPVLSARLTMIDPYGLGANFPFKYLPESIRGNTVYSESDEIRSQMRDLTEHLRRVTQRYLARDYSNIEDYNKDAGELVEPYRILCVADYPAKFDNDAMDRLQSVAEKGVPTGTYIIMHINEDDIDPRQREHINQLKQYAHIVEVKKGQCHFDLYRTIQENQIAKQYEFQPDLLLVDDVFNTNFNRILQAISQEAEKGEFKGIDFETILSGNNIEDRWAQNSTEKIIDVPIGRTGARDPLNFWLGRRPDGRIAAHALIGGQTGSGKSNLLHVLINSVALNYSPEDIRLYLLDFKEGVSFKPYADYHLPHVNVIAIESEREFGLSVLTEMQNLLEERGALFKEKNVDDIGSYREQTNKKLPRILLIIDEFQMLFIEQDSLATRAGQILDDLARRGRAFGIHIVMGSQSVKVANLPNSTYGQFATRILLQSPEQEVAALLGANNKAASSLLERPGEIIYNDQGGQRDRNLHGQVARLESDNIPTIAQEIRQVTEKIGMVSEKKPIVFYGNRPAEIADNKQLDSLYNLTNFPSVSDVKQMFGLSDWLKPEYPGLIWLGESIAIKPHTSVGLRRRGRNNLLLVGDRESEIFGMLGASFLSLAAQYSSGNIEFQIIDLSLKESEWEDTCENFRDFFGHNENIIVQERRRAMTIVDYVHNVVTERENLFQNTELEDENLGHSIYFVLAGVHRHSDLRSVPGKFAGREEPSEYANKVIDIIRKGPDLGIHTIMWADSVKNFESILGRQSLAYFNQRVALAMTKDDSQTLLREPTAASLKPFRALLLDDEQVSPVEKFKPYELPSNKDARKQLFQHYGDMLKSRQ